MTHAEFASKKSLSKPCGPHDMHYGGACFNCGFEPVKLKRDTYQPTQTWKQSRPVKLDGAWRILNHAGQIVGAYETKKLAQRAIDKVPYLH